MKRDFIEDFIDKVSINLTNETVSAESLNKLKDESIELLQRFGREVPTGYAAGRSLAYFHLRLEQLSDTLKEKKSN